MRRKNRTLSEDLQLMGLGAFLPKVASTEPLSVESYVKMWGDSGYRIALVESRTGDIIEGDFDQKKFPQLLQEQVEVGGRIRHTRYTFKLHSGALDGKRNLREDKQVEVHSGTLTCIYCEAKTHTKDIDTICECSRCHQPINGQLAQSIELDELNAMGEPVHERKGKELKAGTKIKYQSQAYGADADELTVVGSKTEAAGEPTHEKDDGFMAKAVKWAEKQFGIAADDAERVVDGLDVGEWGNELPTDGGTIDTGHSDKVAGHNGYWVAWKQSGSGVMFTNAGPMWTDDYENDNEWRESVGLEPISESEKPKPDPDKLLVERRKRARQIRRQWLEARERTDRDQFFKPGMKKPEPKKQGDREPQEPKKAFTPLVKKGEPQVEWNMSEAGGDKHYELARAYIAYEFDSFDSDPQGYIGSMGWDMEKFSRINELKGELAFTKEDVEELARILADKGISTQAELGRDVDAIEKVDEYVLNLVAKHITDAYKKLTSQVAEAEEPITRMSGKYHSLELEDGKYKFSLGNWSDAGWHWEGDSDDGMMLLFLYRLVNSRIWNADIKKELLAFEGLADFYKKIRNDDGELKELAYTVAGDNVTFHFGHGFWDMFDDYEVDDVEAVEKEVKSAVAAKLKKNMPSDLAGFLDWAGKAEDRNDWLYEIWSDAVYSHPAKTPDDEQREKDEHVTIHGRIMTEESFGRRRFGKKKLGVKGVRSVKRIGEDSVLWSYLFEPKDKDAGITSNALLAGPIVPLKTWSAGEGRVWASFGSKLTDKQVKEFEKKFIIRNFPKAAGEVKFHENVNRMRNDLAIISEAKDEKVSKRLVEDLKSILATVGGNLRRIAEADGDEVDAETKSDAEKQLAGIKTLKTQVGEITGKLESGDEVTVNDILPIISALIGVLEEYVSVAQDILDAVGGDEALEPSREEPKPEHPSGETVPPEQQTMGAATQMGAETPLEPGGIESKQRKDNLVEAKKKVYKPEYSEAEYRKAGIKNPKCVTCQFLYDLGSGDEPSVEDINRYHDSEIGMEDLQPKRVMDDLIDFYGEYQYESKHGKDNLVESTLEQLGLKRTEKDGLYGLETADGNIIAEPIYQWIDDVVNANGMVRVRHKDGTSGAIEAFIAEAKADWIKMAAGDYLGRVNKALVKMGGHPVSKDNQKEMEWVAAMQKEGSTPRNCAEDVMLLRRAMPLFWQFSLKDKGNISAVKKELDAKGILYTDNRIGGVTVFDFNSKKEFDRGWRVALGVMTEINGLDKEDKVWQGESVTEATLQEANWRTVSDDKGNEVLISYQTPVAAKVNGKFYKTSEHYSVTTSKHVNQWLRKNNVGPNVTVKPPKFFEKLVKISTDELRIPAADADDGTSGQDRKNYSDTQDRDSYMVGEAIEGIPTYIRKKDARHLLVTTREFGKRLVHEVSVKDLVGYFLAEEKNTSGMSRLGPISGNSSSLSKVGSDLMKAFMVINARGLVAESRKRGLKSMLTEELDEADRKRKLKDQYGNDVPNDLVVLDDYLVTMLTKEQLDMVDKADWYEVENSDVILVSASAIDNLSETDPLDVGIDLAKAESIMLIDRPLHRYSSEDGFYHA